MTATNQRARADLAARRGPGAGPDGPVARDPQSGQTLRRILGFLAPYRVRLVGAAVLIVVSVVAALLGPWLQGVAIDRFIAGEDRDGLARIVALLAGLYAVAWVSSLVYSRMIATLAQRALAAMRKQLGERLQQLSMRFFDTNPTGDLMSRVTNDVDAVEQLVSQNLLTIFWALAQLISLLTIMFVLDWRMTIAALIPVPVSFAALRMINRGTGPRFGRFQAQIGRINSIAEERLSGQRTVIALNRQSHVTREFAEANEAARKLGIAAQSRTAVMMPLMFGIGNLSTVSVIATGAWLAVSGDGAAGGGVTVGLIASFISYAGRVGQPFGRIAGTITSIYAALAGGRRVFDLLDEEPDIADSHDAVELPPVQGRVEFDHVDFGYIEGVPVLHDVNFVAEPGQMIGLVGPTGAGKSTIINVLNRFYDISAGAVRVDGHDIRDVSRDSLRSQLGIVLQRTYLFTDTVRANIAFGKLDATDDEVLAAAKLANADRFITALPEGYDTVVSEGGTNLSLGQRQLLAIARAALADPALLVLDEATSSVDTRTERDLQSALMNLMADRTSFVIAHRLSTVRNADKILVIDDGRIIEAGTHDELIAAAGHYADLWSHTQR